MSPEEELVWRRIEEDTETSRRAFVGGVAGAAAVAALVAPGAFAKGHHGGAESAGPDLSAKPPAGFVPFSAPGLIAKVKKADCLMPNGYYPKEDAARAMLERAMKELTGKDKLADAARLFVHPEDKVCVKVNGIATKNMSTNKELVLPFIEAMIAAGVSPENITVLEQWGSFLAGTRITDKNLPAGVKIAVHNNESDMASRLIPGTGVRTKFCRPLLDASAVINFSLIKDHSICGYTGCLKNMTHGTIVNPSAYHRHHAAPQIALLYAQDVIRSRVRLNITDGFKLMADGGPLWKKPEFVIPHESVYVTTDPVAMDAIGWDLVEEARKKFALKTLTEARRIPAYIRAAADLGLGIEDRKQIRLREATI